jgi:hypothetical protein
MDKRRRGEREKKNCLVLPFSFRVLPVSWSVSPPLVVRSAGVRGTLSALRPRSLVPVSGGRGLGGNQNTKIGEERTREEENGTKRRSKDQESQNLRCLEIS